MTRQLLTAIKQSELVGRQVIYKTKNLGKLTRILFDPFVDRVEALVFESNKVQPQKWLLSRTAIESIDKDSILICPPEKKVKPSELIKLKSLRNQELWSGKNRLGRLLDYNFDPKSGVILNYLFVYNNNDWPIFADRIYQISPAALSYITSRYAIVEREMIKTALPYKQQKVLPFTAQNEMKIA